MRISVAIRAKPYFEGLVAGDATGHLSILTNERYWLLGVWALISVAIRAECRVVGTFSSWWCHGPSKLYTIVITTSLQANQLYDKTNMAYQTILCESFPTWLLYETTFKLSLISLNRKRNKDILLCKHIFKLSYIIPFSAIDHLFSFLLNSLYC